MTHDYERRIHEDAPEPSQLKRLAAVGAASAATRQQLKRLPRRESRAHYFIDEIDFVGADELGQGEPQEIRHRMAGRVGVRLASDGASKVWSLKYFDTYWVNQDSGWQGERTLYRFEWDRRGTLLAERTLTVVGVERPETTLQDYVEHFQVADDEAAIWHVRQEMAQVTAGDCEGLVHDARAYFSLAEHHHQRANLRIS